jgi:cobalt-zinc-cadmium efflux system outer membrane protein
LEEFMRSSFGAGFAALFISTAVAAAPRPLSQQEAVALALERNADLQTLAAEVSAAQARLSGASPILATNPEVSVAAGPRHFESRTSTDATVEVAQRIEIAGQRGLRMQAAEAGIGAAEARLQARKAEVAADARAAFVRVLAADEQLALASAAVDLARSGLAAAEERKRVGAASQIEINTARVEVGRAFREQLAAIRRKASAGAELRLLLALPSEDDVRPQGTLSQPPLREGVDVSSLEQQRESRADLRAARQDLTAARSERSLAGREVVPSPKVGVSLQREEGANIVQGTIGIDLPLFNRNQTARGTAAVRERQAQIALAALERRISQEIALAAGRYQAAANAASVYRGEVLAASEQNLTLVTEAYRAGKIDFLQLVVLRRSAVEARLGFIEAIEELNAADAQLDRVLGRIP